MITTKVDSLNISTSYLKEISPRRECNQSMDPIIGSAPALARRRYNVINIMDSCRSRWIHGVEMHLVTPGGGYLITGKIILVTRFL